MNRLSLKLPLRPVSLREVWPRLRRPAKRVLLGALFSVFLVLAAAGAEGPRGAEVGAEPLASLAPANPAFVQSVGSGLFVFGARDAASFGQANSSGGNPLLSWADLEPSQGVYDWSALDRAIADALSTGRRLVPRIYTNVDYFGQATPGWFFALSGAEHYYTSPAAEAQGIMAPVPWDPVYKQEFGAFLRALGSRYDGNPAIEFFQTNAGGGLYGELVMSASGSLPAGYSPQLQVDTSAYWLDRWREAFPNTRLSYMINDLGYGIAEVMAGYAARYGFYLQQNSPWLSPAAADIFRKYQDSTGIVMEVEDAGCRSATGPGFDAMIAHVFGYGFAIDYLGLCENSFQDPATAAKLPDVLSRLRR